MPLNYVFTPGNAEADYKNFGDFFDYGIGREGVSAVGIAPTISVNSTLYSDLSVGTVLENTRDNPIFPVSQSKIIPDSDSLDFSATRIQEAKAYRSLRTKL